MASRNRLFLLAFVLSVPLLAGCVFINEDHAPVISSPPNSMFSPVITGAFESNGYRCYGFIGLCLPDIAVPDSSRYRVSRDGVPMPPPYCGRAPFFDTGSIADYLNSQPSTIPPEGYHWWYTWTDTLDSIPSGYVWTFADTLWVTLPDTMPFGMFQVWYQSGYGDSASFGGWDMSLGDSLHTATLLVPNPNDSLPPEISGTSDWPDTIFTGPYSVASTIFDSTALYQTLLYYHTSVDTVWRSVGMILTDTLNHVYTGDLPAANAGDTVFYYVFANDVGQYDTTDPGGAPANYYSFVVLADAVPPAITYVDSLGDDADPPFGPYPVKAVITDNAGPVASARLYFAWDTTQHYVDMAFVAADTFSGEMNIPEPAQNETLHVSYWVWAQDLALNDTVSKTYEFGAIGPVGIAGGDQNPGIPTVFALGQSFPNPSGGASTIRYQLPQPRPVRLSIYNVTGQLVRRLVEEEKRAGYHEARWNGTDANGRRLASGVYVYHLEAGDYQAIKQMVLLR
jgi:hypothetical protein